MKEGVAIGVKDLMEPDPIDYTNASDWECFRGTLYNVGDATQFPDDASRDLDGDKRPDVVGPYFEVGLRLKTGSTSQPLPFPTDFSFDMKVPRLDATPAPQLIRVVVLQDAPAYFTSTWRDDVVFPFLGSVGPQFTAYVFGGQINDVIQIQGGPVHRITLPGQYRGNPFFNLIVAVEQKTIACLGQTSDLKPDTTFVSVPPLKVAP